MRDKMDILGEQVLSEMAGRSSVGFDFGALVNAAAGVAKTAVEQDAASKAEAKAKSDSDAAVSKAISADAEWYNAEANLFLAQKDPVAKAAAIVQRDAKKSAALAAGAALGTDGAQKRCKKANDSLASALNVSNAAPKDIAKKAKLHGWQTVASAACSQASVLDKPADTALVVTPDSATPSGGNNWLTVKRSGLPTYAWGLIGVGGLGILAVIVKMVFKGKK